MPNRKAPSMNNKDRKFSLAVFPKTNEAVELRIFPNAVTNTKSKMTAARRNAAKYAAVLLGLEMFTLVPRRKGWIQLLSFLRLSDFVKSLFKGFEARTAARTSAANSSSRRPSTFSNPKLSKRKAR